MIEITQYNNEGEQIRTCYTGTKDDLINAGLATPLMFETTQGRARASHLCKSYHPESGEWEIRNYGKRRNKQLIWDVTYYHERFTAAATLKRDREVEEWEKSFERLPEDIKKKVSNCILFLADVNRQAGN